MDGASQVKKRHWLFLAAYVGAGTAIKQWMYDQENEKGELIRTIPWTEQRHPWVRLTFVLGWPYYTVQAMVLDALDERVRNAHR